MTDSTVTIPRRWFKKASVDLLRYDDCRQEVSLLKPRLSAKEEVIKALARDTTTKGERIDFLNAQIQSEKILSATMELNCNEQLQRYVQQAKKAKRKSTFQTVLVTIAAAATGYFIHSISH